MEHTIENQYLKLTVVDKGAEIRSLIRKSDKREIMWQADPKYWGRTSPVLFPIVGNYLDKKSIYNGKTYQMSQHGFARDMEFTFLAQTDNSLSFELKETAETLEKYPFRFTLTITYTLNEKELSVDWKVTNTNDGTMYFSIGGHPAFNLDLDTYTIRFEKDGKPISSFTSNLVDMNTGCLKNGQSQDHTTENGILHLSDKLFENDALVVEDHQADLLTIVDDKGADLLSVTCPCPLFGVWTPTNLHAPFVCIEPWWGRCDRLGFNQKLEEREYGNTLAAGKEFNASYVITVY